MLINNVRVAPVQRGSQDIDKWRRAIQLAEGYSQFRRQLYDLYEDIILDGYLRATLKKRVDQVTNRKIVFVNEEGERDDQLTDLANTSYFEELLEQIMAAKFWGHSLLELYWPAPGTDLPGETLLLPRKNVKPRFGIVTREPHEIEGVQYREKPFADRTIEVGKPEDLGLLMAVSQYVIYKRANFGDWAEYAEVFGIPFRWATYNNEQSREVLEKALETAGSAGYVVAPEDAKLTFLNANVTGQGQEVFRTLREACNEEIGLTVLCNTMTTIESSAGGYAQSKTQADGENEISKGDRRFVMRVLKEQLLPYLERIGYKIGAGTFEFEQEDAMTLHQRIDVDLKVSSQVPIPASYWYTKYRIPVPTAEDPAAEPQQAEPEPENQPNGKEDDEKSGKPGKPKAQLAAGGTSRAELIAALYADKASCPACVNLMTELPEIKFVGIPRSVQDSVAAAVRSGKLTGDTISAELHRQYYKRLIEVVKAGFTRDLNPTEDWPDFALTESMKRNLSAFAAAKHSALVEQLTSLRSLPKSEYDKAARKVMDAFNDRYFRAELITLEFAAHSAGQWRDFVGRTDIYPNLEYTTAADDRVRPTHAQLDGARYPVNHPFWDSHMPPLGYRCRCTVIQTDRPAVQVDEVAPEKGFGNPGKTRKLVQDDHPYFAVPSVRLDVLLEVAETLRAAIELKNVKKRARTQVQSKLQVPGAGPLNMTSEQVDALLASDSLSLATRNALVAELELVLDNVINVTELVGVALMETIVNGELFMLGFVQGPAGWRLNSLTRL